MLPSACSNKITSVAFMHDCKNALDVWLRMVSNCIDFSAEKPASTSPTTISKPATANLQNKQSWQ